MATEIQIAVTPVLEQLKLNFIPDPSGRVGGDMAFEITEDTSQMLKEAMDRDDRLILHDDGTISFSQF